ncbi:MAG: Mov34/MPN/PAD-1 family protein [archaeon]
MSIEEKIEEPIKKTKITREAFQKMNLYARLVSEIAGRDVECAGFLLNESDTYDDIARDVYLSKGQTVAEAEGNFDEEQDAESFAELKKKNKKISGIWHSHGSIIACHSEDDDRHLRKIYITKSKNNKITVGKTKTEPEIKRENEKIKIRSDNNIIQYEDNVLSIRTEKGRILKINIEGKIKEIEEEQLKEEGFVYSIVINKKSYLDNLIERGSSYYSECLIGENPSTPRKLENLELEIIEEENGIVKDEETLVKEVGERVAHEGKPLKENPHYQNILNRYAKKEEKTHNRLREFYQNYKPVDEVDNIIVSIAKIMSGDSKISEELGIKDRAKKIISNYRATRPRKHKSLYRRMKPTLQMTALCAGIGVLGITYLALAGIEKASISYLKKARPEIAQMMERGDKFSEMLKVYHKKR